MGFVHFSWVFYCLHHNVKHDHTETWFWWFLTNFSIGNGHGLWNKPGRRNSQVILSVPFSKAPWSISKKPIKLCVPVSSFSHSGTLFVGIQLRSSSIHMIFPHCKPIYTLMSLLAQLPCKQKLHSKQCLGKSLSKVRRMGAAYEIIF